MDCIKLPELYDIIFGSTKKSLCTEVEKMMHKKFQMSSMGELIFFLGLQVKHMEDGIFISQDKYVTEILKKFCFTNVKTSSTPMETQKPLLKDEDGEEVDVHLYRSMIVSLMYLTSSRPDIMFTVCACERYQVNLKVSHLHAVKRIFRYLKGQPKLGLWYPKDSPFDLVAYTDSDYAGASLDRKSTTRGCQFLGCILISWQCKKQTVVANSTTEAEYVAASSCCGQVLWIQNQLLDYGDSNEKKLIQMIKIHTDKNVVDLLTKAFDGKLMLLGIGVNAGDSKLMLLGINLLLLGKVNAARYNLLLMVVRIGVNAGDSKLMLLGINLLLLGKVNAARYNLLLLVATVKVKTVNREQQLQALVDGKKIIITEATVRRDLQLEDADGVDCLLNATIFKQLTLIGYEKLSQKLTFNKAFFSPQWKFLIHTILQCLCAKTTTWNEFSSTMASAIICLVTNQKFNSCKYIFESMVKNLDNAVKFLMYLRFVQVFLNNQLEGMATHNRIYIAPSHTKKIFAYTKMQGKDFSGRVTPLFPTMVVQAQEKMGEGSTMPTDPQHTPIITQPSSSQPQRKQKSRRPKEKDTQAPQSNVPSDPTNVADEAVNEEPKESFGDQEDASKQGRIDDVDADKDIYLVNVHRVEDMFGVNDLEGDEVVIESKVADKDVNLSVDEVTLAQALVTTFIPTAAAKTITTISSRPIAKGIVFHEQEQAPTLIVSSQQLTQVKDKGKGKMVEEEPMKKMSKKELLKLDEELPFKLQAEEDEEERLAREKVQKVEEANIAWDDIQAKVEAHYQLAQRLQAQEQEELSDTEKATLFVQLLEKRRKHFAAKRAEEKRNRPPTKTHSKKQKVDDDKETEELKQCMEIIPDDGDDVTIEATPLSTKSPTIVDYKSYKEGKKNYFQIIRADGNSQMYLTFGKMLKNFNREDLKVLWSILKARFKKTEPVNYMDTFLHLNLKTMFKHHLEDNIWKNQQGLVKVLNWKLYDSCGVHYVTMQNVLFYLLVEKIYPLTKHTLHQMFNDVKLQVDYEFEMAFELLRLVKKQLKEGYVPE
ncbi:putative ribonuclease H-like domain-containing protein [Tanacetum coccineum]